MIALYVVYKEREKFETVFFCILFRVLNCTGNSYEQNINHQVRAYSRKTSNY